MAAELHRDRATVTGQGCNVRDPLILRHGRSAGADRVGSVIEHTSDDIDDGATRAFGPDTDGVLVLVAGGVDVGPGAHGRGSEAGHVDRVKGDISDTSTNLVWLDTCRLHMVDWGEQEQ